MAVNASGQPTGAVSTSYTPPATVSDSVAVDSLEYYNNAEIEITRVSPDGEAIAKIMTTILAIGKQLAGGQYDDLGVGEMTTSNYPEFKFLEEDVPNRVYSVTGAGVADGVTTAVPLVSASGIQRGDLLRISSTSEIIRVSAVAGNTLTVVRSTGTLNAISAQAIPANATLILIGNATSEGEAGRVSFATPAVEKANYIQKIATSVELIDGDLFSSKYGSNKGQVIKDLMNKKLIEQFKSIEMVALLGQKATGTDSSTNKKWYTAEGLLNTALRGHVGDISGGLTVSSLAEAFGATLPYGSSTKIVFCGTKAMAPIAALFHGSIHRDNIEGVNLKFSYIEVNGGKFILTTHPMMNANAGLDKIAIVCDPTTFKPVYPTGVGMEGEKLVGKTQFHILDNLSNYATKKGEWIAYLGFKNANALSH
jgi:hypothetical protein